MARPVKYKTEAERLQARREQTRKAVNKHRKGVSNNVSNNSMVENNVSNNVSNNSDKNYKLLYELLKIEYKELEDKYKTLLYESEITNEYCKELEEQLNEAKEMGY